MTYPFSSLPENLAAFCAALRRDHQFHIGPRELMDAARGLELVEIADERTVRNALRPILAKTIEHAASFDAAFARFFFDAAGPVIPGRDALAASADVPEPDRAQASSTETRSPRTSDQDPEAGAAETGAVRHIAESDEPATTTVLGAHYSPLESEGTPLVFDPPTREWLEAASRLVARLHASTSRRWRPALRGPRFDFRRTLRTSLHTGGEPVTWRWRAHPRRRLRFVLLIDGSRSMGAFADPALHAAVALSAISANTETFTFSTTLGRVTREARRAASGERRVLHVRQAWGGGTTIGACLADFLLHFGARLLGSGTVIIIASDGLDVGRPDRLREVMAALARRSAAVVWLNPLFETPGYEPTALGMRVARPFVTVLASIRDPDSFASLARTIRLRQL